MFIYRYNSSDDDNYSQPAIFWRDELTEDDRVRLVQNMAQDLRQASPFLWVCIIFIILLIYSFKGEPSRCG